MYFNTDFKLIISIVGMIGTGKTSVINKLSSCGFSTINEGYTSLKLRFDNTLSISKWLWIANWFNNIYDYFEFHPDSKIVFTDRSAIEAGIWTPVCYPYMEPLNKSFKELEAMGYRFITICLFCNDYVLRERINSRLIMEPERSNYNETNEYYIKSLCDSYNNHSSLWDYVIDTSKISVDEVYDQVMRIINNNILIY